VVWSSRASVTRKGANMPANLPLELREEFRSAHMRGTAIELRNRRPMTAVVVTHEQPVLATDGNHPKNPFGEIVVYRQPECRREQADLCVS